MSLDFVLKPLNSMNKTEVMQLMEATGLSGVTGPGHPLQCGPGGGLGGIMTPALLTRPAADQQCSPSPQPEGPAASAPLQPSLPEPWGGGQGGTGLAPSLVSLIHEMQVPREQCLTKGIKWAPNIKSCCSPLHK